MFGGILFLINSIMKWMVDIFYKIFTFFIWKKITIEMKIRINKEGKNKNINFSFIKYNFYKSLAIFQNNSLGHSN